MESSILDEKGYRKKIETYPNFYRKIKFLNWALSGDILVFELFCENVPWRFRNPIGWIRSDDSRVAMNYKFKASSSAFNGRLNWVHRLGAFFVLDSFTILAGNLI